MEEHGFAPTKHDTMHLSQCMQTHLESHHGMQSSPHHGHNGGGGSPWGLMVSHIRNGSNQESKDGGGLT
jgi:hypothetical protein